MFYHEEQARLLSSTKRFKVVIAGRGSGKTEVAKRYLIMQPLATPRGLFFYIAPTLQQARNIAWQDFLELIPKEYLKNKSENTSTIRFTNGAELRIISGEKPERVEGVQWDGGVIDECSDQSLFKLFNLSLGPAMTHKKAWCWLIGIPKRWGVGAKYFYEAFDQGLSNDPDCPFESFHWHSSTVVDPEELDMRRRTLPPADFREQYEASRENTTGLVCPDFGEENIIKVKYDPTRPIIVGSDFNVNPMAWVLAQYKDKALYFFDELFLRNTTTQKTLDHLYHKYPTHTGGWAFCGDATSNYRKTSAALTDYVQIDSDPRFLNKKIAYPKKNPAVQDRITVVNAAICNAASQRRVFIDPNNCKNLISDLSYLSYDDKGEINKVGDLSHMFDAFGYAVMQFLPMHLARPVPSVRILTN